MPETSKVDHEARMLANKALDKIEGHETLCTERWAQTLAMLRSVRNMTLTLALLVIGALGSLVYLGLSLFGDLIILQGGMM